jgi:hypothetical protein
MSAALGVENIIVADDIAKKRHNIAMNLAAWLKSPNLGMISILTAGDKHFFKHVETIKAQTGISLNLWGINPLEVTHFNAGFLGVPPDFEEKRVYSHGVMKQLRYQGLRLRAMLQSPGYFNSSLWDTLSGEYYRSFTKKTDYYHIFDYWRWDEKQIEEFLGDTSQSAPPQQTPKPKLTSIHHTNSMCLWLFQHHHLNLVFACNPPANQSCTIHHYPLAGSTPQTRWRRRV